MTQIVALAAQKGGPGKSTLAVHLAVCAARKRQTVALVDLDPQGSTSGFWAARRAARPDAGAAAKVAVFAARAQELPGMIVRAREQRVDLLLLDSPGRADVTAARVIAAADVVLIPCRPTPYDVAASVETAAEVKRAKVKWAFFVLNQAPSRGTRHDEARAQLEPVLPVCPVVVHNYVDFQDALNDGRSVEELDQDGKAATEVRALFRWLRSL
jgi:chromosome partitioning protein